MSNVDDYHINPQFKIGGTPVQPHRTSFTKIDRDPITPSPVAPATLRMMGKNTQPQQQQQPLMPPVSILTSNDTQNTPQRAKSQSRSSNRELPAQRQPSEIKQFHRKSLGDWDFLETVGAGSMGKVKLAKHHQTSEVCAIKIVNRATKAFLHKEQSLIAPKNEQEILERQKKLEKEISRDKRTIREASLGQVLYHPHICRLFEMCTMSNHFYMLFEFVSGGQLLDYIIQHGSLREHHARKFARGIASALKYLHANNIVHRDLKIENIMISTSGEIKIIDFGLSNVFDNRKLLHTFCGSLYFAAPELLKATPYMGPEVDIWSYGVVLYVLVCGKVPFDDENSSVLHEKIKQGKVEYPNHLSIEIISLLSKMLVVDPLKRANLKQVIEHPWMNRGYDYLTPSYLPKRIPLTPGLIDESVIQEMFRLEFIDNMDETRSIIQGIITEEKYIEKSEEYWSLVSTLKSENQSIQNTNNFDDPTEAYHPLLSMYYLVSEMLSRKLAKLQRRQAQQQSQDEKKQLENAVSILANASKPNEITPVPDNATLNSPMQPIQRKQEYVATSQRTPTQSPMLTTSSSSKYSSNIMPPLKSPVKSVLPAIPRETMDKRPLQILVPPKLSMPEQAHTSPTSRKASEHLELLDNEMSNSSSNNNVDQTTYTQQQGSVSPDDVQDKSAAFGGIFRRLSQRRAQQQNGLPSTPSTQQTQPRIHITPIVDDRNNNRQTIKKTHARTVSEYVPANTRAPSYGMPSYNITTNTKDNYNPTANGVITPPQRSASQKQNKRPDLPALPSNAESILQEQREKQIEKDMQHMKFNNSYNAAETQDEEINANDSTLEDSNDENNPLPPLNVIKGRRYHPSARAKSVGHARRESLKFNRPPVPTSVPYQPELDDHGFLEYSDDNKSDNVSNNSGLPNNDSIIRTSINNGVAATGIINDNRNDSVALLTDEQILKQASDAPPGSMLSIDYPRSLFLKGFFSVQTTSSKPLPIVRYKIISVLKSMNIEFKEVKGGFICVQRAPININYPDNINNDLFSDQQKPQQLLQVPNRSVSRHNSVRRQPSVKYNQFGVPNTPLDINNHERSISITSPTVNAHAFNIPQEISTASIEDMYEQEDILTTSRVQDLNKISGEGNDMASLSKKERPPIKFEIHIVKVRIVGLAGVHFKKVSGNTWLYKELASHILKELNL